MISIYFPTYNRSSFVKRALDYYEMENFTGEILIGDSSDEEESQIIRAHILDKKSITIRYYRYPPPPFPVITVVDDLITKVTTPYCMGSGDDDFNVPAGIAKCIEFLENNQDYAAAHGLRLNFSINRNGPYGQVQDVSLRREHELLSEDPLSRLWRYSSNPHAPGYFVVRTELLRRMFPPLDFVPPWGFFMEEFFPGCMVAITGKVKQVDSVYVYMQQHHEKNLQWDNNRNMYKTILSPGFLPTISYIRSTLSPLLSAQSGMSQEESTNVIDSVIWRVTKDMLAGDYPAYAYPVAENSDDRNDNRRGFMELVIAILNRYARYTARKRAEREMGPYTLRNIQSGSSPYFSSFNAIQKACGNPGER
jgi:glycosyltransferase domain-containing protein